MPQESMETLVETRSERSETFERTAASKTPRTALSDLRKHWRDMSSRFKNFRISNSNFSEQSMWFRPDFVNVHVLPSAWCRQDFDPEGARRRRWRNHIKCLHTINWKTELTRYSQRLWVCGWLNWDCVQARSQHYSNAGDIHGSS